VSPTRIVCLVPSLTEALFALGLGDRVVGVTDWCVHPAEGVAKLPKLGGTKNPDLEAIRALRPDLVRRTGAATWSAWRSRGSGCG
jgi:ABC-type Fe3+-hydroxamate transport system substrate-binding protein